MRKPAAPQEVYLPGGQQAVKSFSSAYYEVTHCRNRKEILCKTTGNNIANILNTLRGFLRNYSTIIANPYRYRNVIYITYTTHRHTHRVCVHVHMRAHTHIL